MSVCVCVCTHASASAFDWLPPATSKGQQVRWIGKNIALKNVAIDLLHSFVAPVCYTLV